VPVSFVYKGTASNVGGIGTTVTDPEYPGVSTIKDAVSGTTIPYMNMKGDYSRPIEGLHQNRVYLSSEIDGVRWSIYLELYGAARGVDGTYDYWSEGEPAAGLFTGSVSADDANAFFSGGTITVAETGGVYTITLEDISAVRNVSDTEPAAILNGTYTGICSEFYDSTSN
jgi:hypothetical protein